MLKRFTLIVFILFQKLIFAQPGLNNSLKVRASNRDLPEQFTVLVKGDINSLQRNAGAYNYTFNYNAGDIASITTGMDALSKLIESKIIRYAEFIEPHKQALNDTMVIRNRIKGIHTGAPPLPSSFDGSGVVVGIIDTGTDWRHNDFKDANGQTRIQFLWDQKIPGGGQTPMPYNYGKEWTAAQINASLCTHDDVAGNSHGTHVAGVAAGNGLATGSLTGCAPKADLVVVALNFNLPGPTIADAVNYIFSKATLLGKPCVINASVGDYYGSHDGTDMEAKLIENMVKDIPGRVMVAAAGNGGLAKFHTLTQPMPADTLFTWITNNTSTINYWCYGDTAQVKNLKFSVGANRANYFDLGRIGFKDYNYGIPAVQNDTLKYNGNRIGIVKTSASINTYGVYELFVQIKPDTLNLLWRIETKGSGLHHAWNFDLVSSGLPTQLQFPPMAKYIKPDTLYSIVSGFHCLNDITSVANYGNLSKYYDYNNALQTAPNAGGARVDDSSVGPTRDGKVKPDIAATGAGVFAAAAVNLQPTWIANIPQFMAPGGQHVYGSGTSAAAPVVAGFAALFLQYNPNLTSIQVRNAIVNCAYSDVHTGMNLPNNGWGYGKLDGKASMMCSITSISEVKLKELNGQASPNPFSGHTEVKFSREVYGDVFVYNAEGKLLLQDKINGDSYRLNSSALANYTGLLIVRVSSPETSGSFKLLKQN